MNKAFGYIELALGLFATVGLIVLCATGQSVAPTIAIRAGWLIPGGIGWGIRTINEENRRDRAI